MRHLKPAGCAVLAFFLLSQPGAIAQNAAAESQRATGSDLPRYRKDLGVDRFLTPKKTLLIDLPNALRLVHCNSLDVAVVEQRLATAQIDEEVARFAILPDISIGPRYERHTGHIQETQGQVVNASRNSLFTGGLLSFNWEPGRILFEPLAAHLRIRSVQELREDTLRNVALDAALAYYDVARAQYELVIAQSQLERSSALAGFFREQFEQGQVLKADYLRVKTQEDAARAAVLAAERAREIAVQTLLNVTRLDHNLDLITVGPDLAKMSLIDPDQSVDLLLANAFAHRADLRQLREQVEIARVNLKNKGISPFLPSSFLSYSLGDFRGGPGNDFESGGSRADFVASVQWSLKNLGLSNMAEYERTWYEWEIANLQYVQLCEQIDTQVRQAIIALRAAERLVDVRKTALPNAREALELSETRLRSGEGLAVDVLQAQDVLTRAESEYIAVLIDYDRAQITLWNRIGMLMPVDEKRPLKKKEVFELKTYTGVPEVDADAFSTSMDEFTTGSFTIPFPR